MRFVAQRQQQHLLNAFEGQLLPEGDCSEYAPHHDNFYQPHY